MTTQAIHLFNRLFGRKKATLDLATATQWQLIGLKMRQHKLAWYSMWFLVWVYFIAIFAEFFAPFDPSDNWRRYTYAPPQAVSLIESTEDGWRWAPHLEFYNSKTDPRTLKRHYTLNENKKVYFSFFGETERYYLLGFIPMNRKFVVPHDPKLPFFVLGSDRMGRDMLSRLIYGARISLSVGLMGVFTTFVLGIVIGGISGYFGGAIDNFIQRSIEFMKSIPTLPLWMALSASLPAEWSSLTKYFLITIILGLVSWPDMARVVRSRFMSLRSEEYVAAAWLDGNTPFEIIRRYMVPNFLSHIIAVVTLAIPAMILGETALSFLGLGLQAPMVSWGVLLQEAQNIRALAEAAWLLIPAAAVIVVILAMNFVGDGLRDACDPYHDQGAK
ncbi:ABC transporter permease [Vibrio vulnificus]|uniref:ABC transporter permease n=1 Tax=Vibrio TaxID=662 RepID=UPI00063DAFAF|nr:MULTISPECIES: ABC transporter permease [Vibrio]OJI56129.1 Oligopeptide transport system permease protein OppC [Vibrio fluvialis]EIU7744619.1 ABC transporter permease [Vibrio vulnificus]EJN6714039.1 ABC transporter permease [Vibrio vulnificus]EJQ9990377.1 ABC transporter permease [Vibrio vulnificus]EKD7162513.1 ABC transporter permease [Vibrio vulnificus]